MRVGVIGAGFVAQVTHLHAFARLPNATITAIAEPHDALRQTVAERHGISRGYDDYHDLLDDPDIDAVVVCMPRRAQSGIVADAVRAKRAVLSEKPIAMTMAQAEPIVASAATLRTSWTVGYMKRHDLGVRKFAALLAELVEDGGWGAILDADMRDFCVTYGVPIPAHDRRKTPRPTRYPEGPLVPDFLAPECAAAYEYTNNVASHDINLLRFLFGDVLKPVSMRARAGGAQRAVFDAGDFAIALTLGPGDMGGWDQVLNVTFQKGRATLVLPSPLARQESASIELVHGPDRRVEQIRVPNKDHVWAFEGQARSFVDSVLSGTEPETSGSASIADLALIESLWKTVDWRQ